MRSKIDKGPAFPCCLLLAAVLSDELSWGPVKVHEPGYWVQKRGSFCSHVSEVCMSPLNMY
jgi:hypothetical protein